MAKELIAVWAAINQLQGSLRNLQEQVDQLEIRQNNTDLGQEDYPCYSNDGYDDNW